jgi:TonB family protein
MAEDCPYHSIESRQNALRLFGWENTNSRAVTIINKIALATVQLVLFIGLTVYLNQSTKVQTEGFDTWGCNWHPTGLQDFVVVLVLLDICAIIVGAFIYLTRSRQAVTNCDNENRKEAVMREDVNNRRQPFSLSKIRIAAPCSAEWRFMYGDDRVRFCGQCSMNVYNLSAMTKEAAEDLIRKTEGRLCIRFYRRNDGTILTDNCPLGLHAIKKRLSSLSAAIATAVLSFLANVGLLWWVDRERVEVGIFPVSILHQDQVHPLYPTVTTGVLVRPGSSSEVSTIQRGESFIRDRAILKVMPIFHSTDSARIQGDAVVKVIISKYGDVDEATLIKGHPLLRELAEDAASRWEFEPILVNGKPARVESTLTFHFGK